MRPHETHRAPFFTAAWMIGLPLAFAFVATAGAGTVLDGLARLADTMWSAFGGASLVLGIALMGWVLFSAWRGQSKDVHG